MTTGETVSAPAGTGAPVRRLFVTVLLSSIAFFVVVPLLPLYLVRESGTQTALTWSGPVLAASFIAGAICSPLWGTFSDRYGARRMMIRASIAVTLTQAALVFATSPWSMMGIRIVHGCMAGLVPATMTYAVRAGSAYGRDLSVLSVARSAGALIGPAVGGLTAATLDLDHAFLVAAALTALCVVISLTLPPDAPAADSVARTSILVKLRSVAVQTSLRYAYSMVLIVSVLSGMLQIAIPLSVAKGGLSDSAQAFWIGAIFSASGLTATLTGALWGLGADRYGWRRLLPLATAGSAAGATVAIFGDGPFSLLISFLVCSMFGCEVTTLLSLSVLETTSSTDHGAFMGLMNTVFQVGFGLGPLIGGLLVALAGPSAVYTSVAVLLALVTIDSCRRSGSGLKAGLHPLV
jgi:MFS transporter, DHA1 family, multidrug resistance protein